ncbi:MAG: gluconate 2-dehydrogenase subunit 3 family protein [Gemmatimonadota bacterium]
MNRREALQTAGVVLGSVALGSTVALTACAREPVPTDGWVLNGEDQALAEAVADTLLPATPDSPGAADAAIGTAMNLLLSECYSDDDQRRVLESLAAVRRQARQHGSDRLAQLPRARREEVLRDLDAQATGDPSSSPLEPLRGLALHAFFSSETGMTRVLRYVAVPGRWIGCTRLEPGQPAWA